MFKDAMTTVAIEVVGYRALKSQRKGSVWWTNEVMERKRRVYRKMLHRNVEEEIRARRRIEYMLNRKVKELVKESKRKSE